MHFCHGERCAKMQLGLTTVLLPIWVTTASFEINCYSQTCHSHHFHWTMRPSVVGPSCLHPVPRLEAIVEYANVMLNRGGTRSRRGDCRRNSPEGITVRD
ncbi:hypothetical protein EDC04DRAFT_2642069 [Pisolithus marmoratus]|nr:hypothetical protein EDC04DRAFT_2642069 [Pisolithus marmoratus]